MATTTPLYSGTEVQLSDCDGNAFAIISRVARALRDDNVPKHIIDHFIDEAKSGDYDHLLQTCMKWVDVL